ncbi:hypothetical protein [Calothrix sp. NIES-2098]|uniref:hypothetical protein n=1 Tax=Calothrix sp. NIES-2098 TaxID=1954171 RepID=UPI000B614182|nr:hypothetical protein NIES2098_04870 [Calothrix sp. NIES-2098]
MLNNITRNSRQKFSSSVEPIIPDPWETPSLPVETKYVPDSRQILTETHALFPPLGITEARRLPPASNPIKVLLQDELRLKVFGGRLKTQIEQALGLLCWIERLTTANI